MLKAITLCCLVLCWCVVFIVFWQLTKWAKQRKSGAYVFGALVQMLLPDPQINKTIEVIEQQKSPKAEKPIQQGKKIK